MNRRSFLGSMIGGIAAAAAVRTFPFRVFSFPNKIVIPKVQFNIGDVVTFDGCFQVNPRTGKNLSILKQFVVTEECRSLQRIKLHPLPLTSGIYKNVSAMPAGSRVRSFVGSPNSGFSIHPDVAVHSFEI